MTLEIDITKLKTRRAELQEELSKIDGLITLAEMYGKEPAAALATTPITKQFRPPTEADFPRRGFTPGLRRAVTLALYTGPSTEYDLSRALAWPISRVKQVLIPMLKFELVVTGKSGKLELTDEGKTQALWFQSNPDKLVYRRPVPPSSSLVAKP